MTIKYLNLCHSTQGKCDPAKLTHPPRKKENCPCVLPA